MVVLRNRPVYDKLGSASSRSFKTAVAARPNWHGRNDTRQDNPAGPLPAFKALQRQTYKNSVQEQEISRKGTRTMCSAPGDTRELPEAKRKRLCASDQEK